MHRNVRLERAQDAPVVDPVMTVEPLILGGDERLTDVAEDLLERQDGAALDTELGNQPPVGRVDLEVCSWTLRPLRGRSRNAGAALRGTDAGPRPVREAGGVQQGENGRNDNSAPLHGIEPPTNDPWAAR